MPQLYYTIDSFTFGICKACHSATIIGGLGLRGIPSVCVAIGPNDFVCGGKLEEVNIKRNRDLVLGFFEDLTAAMEGKISDAP